MRSAWLGMGRRFTWVAFLFLFAGAMLAFIPPALACSCASDTPGSPESMRQVIELSEGGVFVGTVIGRGQIDGRHIVTMQVERVIKGEFGPIVNIDTTDKFREICGAWNPAVGGRVGILVDGSPAHGWTATSCSLELDPGDLLAYAPSTYPPDPAIEPFGPVALGVGWTRTTPWTLIAALTVILIAGSLFFIRRRRSVTAETGG
jgi:hypothetical protein